MVVRVLLGEAGVLVVHHPPRVLRVIGVISFSHSTYGRGTQIMSLVGFLFTKFYLVNEGPFCYSV